jgi:PAS domain-containing protein
MSGNASIRGYLLQTIICLLDALQNDSKWVSLSLEPHLDSEKVDIVWYYTDPDEVKVTQVKSSQNQINKPHVKRWAKELEDSIQATSYELTLIGPCSESVIKLGKIGKVDIPTPEVLNIDSLIERSAHRLDGYLENREMSRVSAASRELLIRALVTKLETYSTKGEKIPKEDFDQLLKKWVLTSSNITFVPQYPELTLRIFPLNYREYRDEIRFLQLGDSSSFKFGLALTNSAKGTVAKDINITIYVYWQDGVRPKHAPTFEVPANTGWEYYHDKITYWDAAVLRFSGYSRDRCPFGQPLEWIFSLKLRERLIGEFLFCYQISSTPMREEASGELKIYMG